MDGKFLDAWLKSIGRSRTTGHRWVKSGKITVKPVYGRNYISQAEIDRFFREGINE